MQRCEGSGTLAIGLAVALLLAASGLASPVVTPFPEYVAEEGSTYVAVIPLDDWVEDPTAPDEDLVWNYPRGTTLRLGLTPDRHLVVRPPNADWQGTETVTLTVCNPVGECASQDVVFRVDNTPDDPVIEWIPDRVAGEGKPFPDVDLRYFGWDPDGDDLTWNVRGGAVVTAAVADGVLHVEAPDGWIGRDPITLELTDSTGRTTSRTVDCVVAKGAPVAITSLGVEGILIECGATRILIDALVRSALPLSTSERERLQGAAPPYDAVSLALVTHPHYDHFDAGYTARFLLHSPGTRLIGLSGAVDALRQEARWEDLAARVVEIPFSPGEQTEMHFGDVRVAAIHLEHSGLGNVPNLGYLIDVGGTRILHLGDATDSLPGSALAAAFGWPALGIDVLLASGRWVTGGAEESLAAEAVAPRFAIPIHVAGACPLSRSWYDVGDAALVLLCAKGSSWIVPPRGGS
ncbi:MAG: MBL fold metallo-hydrolase [Candidatus Bipolaricaulis sp.]|nr:MBL fold metallo-hydrolase [Candidatus Bipolaricaulis sp.]